MPNDDPITDIYKKIAVLANQNVQLQADITKLIQHDTYQLKLINHQAEYLSSLNGQNNLLLQFILSEPSNLLRFAAFAKTISDSTAEHQKEMKAAAQWLLNNGLQRFVPQQFENAASPQAGSSPPNTNQEDSPQLGANVIQFPKPPKNENPDP
jgi:hypothetical protein